jgi:hypothetical protein
MIIIKAFEFVYFDETYTMLARSQESAEEYFNKYYLDEAKPDEKYNITEITGDKLTEKSIWVVKQEFAKKIHWSVQDYIEAYRENIVLPWCIAFNKCHLRLIEIGQKRQWNDTKDIFSIIEQTGDDQWKVKHDDGSTNYYSTETLERRTILL